MRLSHRLYKLKPIISTSEMIRHLETLKLIKTVKKYPVLWQTDHKEYGRKRPRDTGCCNASVTHLLYNVRETVVLRSVEMRIFGCGMHRTFCTWFSTNYPLTTFHILYSAKYPHPALTSCGFIGERLANVCHHINHCIARHLKLDSVCTSGTGHIILVTPHLEPKV